MAQHSEATDRMLVKLNQHVQTEVRDRTLRSVPGSFEIPVVMRHSGGDIDLNIEEEFQESINIIDVSDDQVQRITGQEEEDIESSKKKRSTSRSRKPSRSRRKSRKGRSKSKSRKSRSRSKGKKSRSKSKGKKSRSRSKNRKNKDKSKNRTSSSSQDSGAEIDEKSFHSIRESTSPLSKLAISTGEGLHGFHTPPTTPTAPSQRDNFNSVRETSSSGEELASLGFLTPPSRQSSAPPKWPVSGSSNSNTDSIVGILGFKTPPSRQSNESPKWPSTAQSNNMALNEQDEGLSGFVSPPSKHIKLPKSGKAKKESPKSGQSEVATDSIREDSVREKIGNLGFMTPPSRQSNKPPKWPTTNKSPSPSSSKKRRSIKSSKESSSSKRGFVSPPSRQSPKVSPNCKPGSGSTRKKRGSIKPSNETSTSSNSSPPSTKMKKKKSRSKKKEGLSGLRTPPSKQLIMPKPGVYSSDSYESSQMATPPSRQSYDAPKFPQPASSMLLVGKDAPRGSALQRFGKQGDNLVDAVNELVEKQDRAMQRLFKPYAPYNYFDLDPAMSQDANNVDICIEVDPNKLSMQNDSEWIPEGVWVNGVQIFARTP